jgi:NADH:ubiquinone oxidoreductase subunit 6 (subunit J)
MPAEFLNILLFVAMAAVVVTLIFGLYSLFRGGEEHRSRSNKLMRLRVLLQFVAIVVLMTVYYFKNQAGG